MGLATVPLLTILTQWHLVGLVGLSLWSALCLSQSEFDDNPWRWTVLVIATLASLLWQQRIRQRIQHHVQQEQKMSRANKASQEQTVAWVLFCMAAYVATQQLYAIVWLFMGIYTALCSWLKGWQGAFTGFFAVCLLSAVMVYVRPPFPLSWLGMTPTIAFLGAGIVALCQWQVAMMQQELAVEHLQSLATTDALTGLINRRQFNQQLTMEMARARRHASPLTLVMFDIDHFKNLNDQFGHPAGDRLLKELGQLIQQNVREHDISARYGGEEFALILPETTAEASIELMERLRILVERKVFCLPDQPLAFTISIGIAEFDAEEDVIFSLIQRADVALYAAKHHGRNRVVCGYESLPEHFPVSS